MFVAIVVAFLSGVTRTVSRMANARLSERIGPFQSTFFNYAVGLICSAAALSLGGEPVQVPTLAAAQVPAWAYLGGAVGVAFVVLSNLTTPKLSALSMTLLIFVGQVATGIAMDVALGQDLSLGKVAGGVLILTGLLWNQLADEKRKQERSSR